MSSVMRFSVLGPVRAWRGDTELDLGPPKQRALLALLLVHAGHPVPPHEIVAVLWGADPPAAAATVVYRHVGGLRRLFEPGLATRGASRWLVRGSGGYRLDVDPQTIDLIRFRGLRQQATRLAEQGEHGAPAETLLAALELWHGPTAAGIPAEIRAHPAFASVDDERLSALKSAAEHAPAANREVADRVLIAVRDAAVDHPLDEVLQSRLMLILTATGKQAEALEVYRTTRRWAIRACATPTGPPSLRCRPSYSSTDEYKAETVHLRVYPSLRQRQHLVGLVGQMV